MPRSGAEHSLQGLGAAAFNVNKIKSLLKTKANKAFFWSGKTNGIGGAERALEIAKKNGGTTLENLIESKGIDMPIWDINDASTVNAWREASQAFASQASGDVRAVIGSSLRKGNIWEEVELPMLKKNTNVKKIIKINPETLEETVIFRR